VDALHVGRQIVVGLKRREINRFVGFITDNSQKCRRRSWRLCHAIMVPSVRQNSVTHRTASVLRSTKRHEISSVAAGFGRHGMPPPTSNPDLWPFDLETGVRVVSKVENLPSKSGQARPLGSRIIRYVRSDGQTDRRTDGQMQRLFLPSIRGRRHKKSVTQELAPCN